MKASVLRRLVWDDESFRIRSRYRSARLRLSHGLGKRDERSHPISGQDP